MKKLYKYTIQFKIFEDSEVMIQARDLKRDFMRSMVIKA